MSDDLEEKSLRVPSYARGAPPGSMDCIGSVKEAISKPAPRAFTWDDARAVATFVRDGLMMVVRGLEKFFDIGKK